MTNKNKNTKPYIAYIDNVEVEYAYRIVCDFYPKNYYKEPMIDTIYSYACITFMRNFAHLTPDNFKDLMYMIPTEYIEEYLKENPNYELRDYSFRVAVIRKNSDSSPKIYQLPFPSELLHVISWKKTRRVKRELKQAILIDSDL